MSARSVARPVGRRARALLLPATRQRRTVGALLLLAFAFYLWTAGTSFPFTFTRSDAQTSADAYNLMTTAFLHGHTYLPLRVPAGLLNLRDPYSLAQNLPYQGWAHDLLLYHGRFYSSWGPSPTLLFLVVRVTGYRLPQSLAVALYCFVGLVAAVALLHVLVRRLLPQTPDWLLTVATIGLSLTNVAPFLLRRPAEYEVAIAGGYCFEMCGLYLVATAALATPFRRGRLALASLLLGLAVLARPPLAAGLLVVVVVAVLLVRRGASRRAVLTAALIPFAACAVVLVAYNEVRFGGASNFGTQYQLAGLDQMHKPIDQLAYIPPGLFSYLLIPGQISLAFPHFFLQTTAQYPFPLPYGYAGTATGGGPEITGGMLTTMPITLLLLGLPLVWRRRRAGERDALLVIGGGTAMCLVVMLLLAYALWATTQRYEVDFATVGLLAAFLLWALLLNRVPLRTWGRRGLVALGLLLTTLGAAAGVAVSFTGYLNLLATVHPGTWDDLQSLTTPLVTLATEITGRPALLSINSPAPVLPPPGSTYTQFDAAGSTMYSGGYPSMVMINSPRAESAALSAFAVPAAKPLAGQIIQVTSQGLAPIAVPVLGPSLRMPITLHRGLNQITLQSESATIQQQEQIELESLEVTP